MAYKQPDYSKNPENNENSSAMDTEELTLQSVADKFNNRNFNCEICNISCENTQSYDAHVRGKNHERIKTQFDLLAMHPEYYDFLVDSNKASKWPLIFKCCDKTIIGVVAFQLHVESNKHQKMMLKTREEGVVPKAVVLKSTVVPKATVVLKAIVPKSIVPKSIVPMVKPNLIMKQNDEVPSSEYLKVSEAQTNWFQCTLCNVEFSKVIANTHLNGQKHMKNLKKLNSPEVIAEPSGGKKKNKSKKRNHLESFWSNQLTDNEYQNAPNWKKYSQYDERHLEAKFKQITIEKEKGIRLTEFVENCEKALKSVSDEMLKEDLLNDENEINKEEVKEDKRILKSVMRIGTFFQGTMFCGENIAECIITVSVLPTLTLLQRLSQHLANKFKELFGETEVLVQLGEEEIVVTNGKEEEPSNYFICIFRITSPIYNQLDKIENTVDALNKETGIQLLRVLRRCKWFQVCLSKNKATCIVLTILRELCLRDEVWNCLDPWVIELLLEKCYLLMPFNNDASALFTTFMQIIGSGFLYEDGYLYDPCEKEETEVLGYLNEQQKEDLTSSAQLILRMIGMKSIYKVLTIERVPSKWEITMKTKNLQPKRGKAKRMKVEGMQENGGV